MHFRETHPTRFDTRDIAQGHTLSMRFTQTLQGHAPGTGSSSRTPLNARRETHSKNTVSLLTIQESSPHWGTCLHLYRYPGFSALLVSAFCQEERSTNKQWMPHTLSLTLMWQERAVGTDQQWEWASAFHQMSTHIGVFISSHFSVYLTEIQKASEMSRKADDNE